MTGHLVLAQPDCAVLFFVDPVVDLFTVLSLVVAHSFAVDTVAGVHLIPFIPHSS